MGDILNGAAVVVALAAVKIAIDVNKIADAVGGNGPERKPGGALQDAGQPSTDPPPEDNG
ncbi:MAG: hypothetical protein ABIN94_05140 [Ferruginibacter sp.]